MRRLLLVLIRPVSAVALWHSSSKLQLERYIAIKVEEVRMRRFYGEEGQHVLDVGNAATAVLQAGKEFPRKIFALNNLKLAEMVSTTWMFDAHEVPAYLYHFVQGRECLRDWNTFHTSGLWARIGFIIVWYIPNPNILHDIQLSSVIWIRVCGGISMVAGLVTIYYIKGWNSQEGLTVQEWYVHVWSDGRKERRGGYVQCSCG